MPKERPKRLQIDYEALERMQKALKDASKHKHRKQRMVREGARVYFVDVPEEKGSDGAKE